MKWLLVVLLCKTVFSSDHNPDENLNVNNPNLFEGDMELTPEQRRRAENGQDVDSSGRWKRGSTKYPKWPGGVMVYQIGPNLAHDSRAMKAIREGMDEWTTKTCIRFKKRTNEADYVYFKLGDGCTSRVGRVGRRQDINLARGCWTRGIVAHEIGHALGFLHEQSRPDRDNYVTIIWENINENETHNFNKYPRSTIDSLGTPYDYKSLMHYGKKAFSNNGQPTIVVKQSGAKIGERVGLSAIDAKQANLLYKQECEGAVSPSPPPECSSNGHTLLNDATRSQGYNTGPYKCDSGLATRWYRFSGASGNRMPTSCVPTYRCGTHAPGWLSGRLPSSGQITNVKVCFRWSNNCCHWSTTIRVRNCGAFYVYQLKKTPACNLRYCGV